MENDLVILEGNTLKVKAIWSLFGALGAQNGDPALVKEILSAMLPQDETAKET
jgi:hypothetical protein